MMLNHPSEDCRPRPTLVGALWCAITVGCLLALAVPFAVFAVVNGFPGNGSLALAVAAALTVLGASIIGWRFLVLPGNPTEKPGIAAPGTFTAVSLPPARHLFPDGPESRREEACGLPVGTERHRPWTFADALIEWTDPVTSTPNERPAPYPTPSAADASAGERAANATISALNRMAMLRVGEIGNETDRLCDFLRVLRRYVTEQGKSLDQAAAALGRAVETSEKGAEVVTHIKVSSQAARSRVDAGHTAARTAAEAAVAIAAPTQRLSELLSLLMEIGFETHLLSRNGGAEQPSARTPIEQTSAVGNDLGSSAQRCSAVAKEMRALVFEIEGHSLNGGRRAEEAADALVETRKHLASIDAIATDTDAVKLQSSLAEARHRVKRSARLAALGVSIAEGTNDLAKQVAVAANGLCRLLSCCTATD